MSKHWFCGLGLLLIAGCGPAAPVASNNQAPQPADTAPEIMPGPPAPTLPMPPVPSLPVPPPGVGFEPPPPPDAPAPTNPAADTTETVKADVGVGIKGRSLDNENGLLVQPAKTYFAVREKVVFQIAIPSAMNLFQGTEGRFPNSHEEFMQKIIQENQIKLPQLPAGQEYLYDPEKAELMVRRPAQ
ncbi:hypothetical protein ETAA8_71000 [Anatilimnocola aggregata]|uniref:Uncharacterized protein n=1 Tax=Anatilimnocola aggregata TaxID=2528021 RepID=A0A517YNY4_9BACT|nr:hypothetical protein [Anatilimnocola aggregata]QDU31938.1 hypothetical protein ETAA8_71000 [Anatilimnocola aggregata]